MNKTVKLIFIIFNVVLLSCNYIFIAFFPHFLLFKWLPFQLAFFLFSMLLAAAVWGVYYNMFFSTQEHVDEMYKDR